MALVARGEASSFLWSSVGGDVEVEAVRTWAEVEMDKSLHCVLALSLADGVEVGAERTSLAVVVDAVVHNLGLAEG